MIYGRDQFGLYENANAHYLGNHCDLVIASDNDGSNPELWPHDMNEMRSLHYFAAFENRAVATLIEVGGVDLRFASSVRHCRFPDVNFSHAKHQ